MSVGTQRSAKTISSQTEWRFLCDSSQFFPTPPSPLCLPPSSSFSSPLHALFLKSHPFYSLCSLFFHPPPSLVDFCLPPFQVSVATFARPPPLSSVNRSGKRALCSPHSEGGNTLAVGFAQSLLQKRARSGGPGGCASLARLLYPAVWFSCPPFFYLKGKRKSIAF